VDLFTPPSLSDDRVFFLYHAARKTVIATGTHASTSRRHSRLV
jgi:hypothetical protein